MTGSQPARVLITRSAHQTLELAAELRKLALEPVAVPALEITEPGSFAALDAALSKLDSFDWLLFTSANAVAAFHRRLHAASGRAEGPPLQRAIPATLRIAAIGAATARALEKSGMTADLVPAKAVAESLAEALLPHARRPDGALGRFLLVRAEEGRDHLPAALEAAGAEVIIAAAYRTVVPAGSMAAVREIFAPGLRQRNAIDAITFTSSSSVRNLLALCEAASVVLPPESLRISIGPITSETLREAGLPPHAESPEATVSALAATVLRALPQRGR